MNLRIQVYFECLTCDSASNEILKEINKKCYAFLNKQGFKFTTSSKSYISTDKIERSELTLNITNPKMFDTLFIQVTKKTDLIIRSVLIEKLYRSYDEPAISTTRVLERELVTHTMRY